VQAVAPTTLYDFEALGDVEFAKRVHVRSEMIR